MPAVRHLDRAPIREAVIDLRITAPSFDIFMLEKLRDTFSVHFPEFEEQRNYETLIQIGQDGVEHAARDLGRGYICRSPEHQTAVTISALGFSFSRLHPYTDWPSVIAEAQKNWELYASVVKVEKITRLGVRFINTFVVPRTRRIGQCLISVPTLPESFTQAELSSSLMRLLLRDERVGITARVTQVLEPTDVGTSVILDTDSFTSDELPPTTAVWDKFSELHDMKNRIFFGSLTDLQLEDFE